ncbi:MAG TPA: protein kinase, partial [Pyrinomonadaceae bacterium]|nr:protein kinase [Pyrinomonadaceae bacterium]
MADENWQKIRQVFDLALRQKPEDRDDYINEVCRDDHHLLAEVKSLLFSFDNSDDFLEQPAVAAVVDMIQPQPRLQTGARLGHYEVVREINSGGMGEVYLAKDQKLDRLVAIKILNERFADDRSNLPRFIREAKAASALNHPNILVIHEIGEADATHYIVSEFIEGRTLRETMLTRSLALSEVIDIAIQVANALVAAHHANLVHRDIKPENIMIRPDGVVKILDFGLAKLIDAKGQFIPGRGESTVTQNYSVKGLILGTVNYMSPEQAKGEPVDELTDIFGLGVVIYEMITGRTPFAGDSMAESFANLINAEPQPIRRSEVRVPVEWERVVSKTIRKNRDERYQSMNRLLEDLKTLKEIVPLSEKVESLQPRNGNATAVLQATGPDVDLKTVPKQNSSTKRNISLAILVLIALVIGATLFWFIKFRNRSITSTALVPTVVKTTQLTTWKGLDLYPALARDGKTIAFSSDRSG